MENIRILTVIDGDAGTPTVFSAKMADDWKITVNEAIDALDLISVIEDNGLTVDALVDDIVSNLKDGNAYWYDENYCFESFCV